MNAVEFVRSSVQGLHQSLLAELNDLNQLELEWQPQPGANPIGGIFLHYIRTEDSMIHDIQRQPSIWADGKWYHHFGLTELGSDPKSHRDYLPAVQASLVNSLAYAQQVMDSTMIYLNALDDDKLDSVPDSQRPHRSIGVIFRAFLLAHGWWHLGEIKYIKGLQGLSSLY